MFKVTIDRASRLVNVAFEGFFGIDVAVPAGIEVRKAIRDMGLGPGGHVTLFDVTKTQVVPPETFELVRGIYTDPEQKDVIARKVAWVTPSALLQMQLRRLCAYHPAMQVFDDRETAMTWLKAA